MNSYHEESRKNNLSNILFDEEMVHEDLWSEILMFFYDFTNTFESYVDELNDYCDKAEIIKNFHNFYKDLEQNRKIMRENLSNFKNRFLDNSYVQEKKLNRLKFKQEVLEKRIKKTKTFYEENNEMYLQDLSSQNFNIYHKEKKLFYSKIEILKIQELLDPLEKNMKKIYPNLSQIDFTKSDSEEEEENDSKIKIVIENKKKIENEIKIIKENRDILKNQLSIYQFNKDVIIKNNQEKFKKLEIKFYKLLCEIQNLKINLQQRYVEFKTKINNNNSKKNYIADHSIDSMIKYTYRIQNQSMIIYKTLDQLKQKFKIKIEKFKELIKHYEEKSYNLFNSNKDIKKLFFHSLNNLSYYLPEVKNVLENSELFKFIRGTTKYIGRSSGHFNETLYLKKKELEIITDSIKAEIEKFDEGLNNQKKFLYESKSELKNFEIKIIEAFKQKKNNSVISRILKHWKIATLGEKKQLMEEKQLLKNICIEKMNSFDILINDSNQNNETTRTYSNINDKNQNSLNLSVSRNIDISNIINFSIPNNINSSDYIRESITNHTEKLSENVNINSDRNKKGIHKNEKIDSNFIEFFNDLDNTELKMLLKLAEFQKNNINCNKTILPENLNKREKNSIASNGDACSNESFVTFTFNEQSINKMNQLDSISITKKYSNNQSIENSIKNEKINIDNSNKTFKVSDYNLYKNKKSIVKDEKNKQKLIERKLKSNANCTENDNNSPDYIKQNFMKKNYSNPNINDRKAHNLKTIQSDEELNEEDTKNNYKPSVIHNYMMNPFIYYNDPQENLFRNNINYYKQTEENLIKRKKPVIAKSADITKPKRVYK